MKTAEQLRTVLHQEKEAFDRVVFRDGVPLEREERLLRWQAFLQRVTPITQELKTAERRCYETDLSQRARLENRNLCSD